MTATVTWTIAQIEASLQAQIDAQKVPATLSWTPPRVITP